MRLALLASMLALSTPYAIAAGSHAGGHGHDEMSVGMPGDAAKVDRAIDIVMRTGNDKA